MVNDRRYFYYFHENNTQLGQADGSSFTATGWGGIIILLNGKQYGLAPVFCCPDNPKFFVLPGTLKIFGSFNKAIVDTLETLYLTTNSRCKLLSLMDWTFSNFISECSNRLYPISLPHPLVLFKRNILHQIIFNQV